MITRCPEPGCRFTTFAEQASGALAKHYSQWHQHRAKRAEQPFGDPSLRPERRRPARASQPAGAPHAGGDLAGYLREREGDDTD